MTQSPCRKAGAFYVVEKFINFWYDMSYPVRKGRLLWPREDLNTTEEDADKLCEEAQNLYPDVEFSVLYGGQPVYDYFISIE